MFSFGIRKYLFVKLFQLCYIYTLRLVVVAVASQVGLLRDSSFDIRYMLLVTVRPSEHILYPNVLR